MAGRILSSSTNGYTVSYEWDDLNQITKIIYPDGSFTSNTYDFINLSSVLEHFDNPVYAVKKVYDMLNISGLCLIITPCTDIIYERGMKRWGCWNTEQHNIYWSKRQLEKLLISLGFEIIVNRIDYSQRFLSFNNI